MSDRMMIRYRLSKKALKEVLERFAAFELAVPLPPNRIDHDSASICDYVRGIVIDLDDDRIGITGGRIEDVRVDVSRPEHPIGKIVDPEMEYQSWSVGISCAVVTICSKGGLNRTHKKMVFPSTLLVNGFVYPSRLEPDRE